MPEHRDVQLPPEYFWLALIWVGGLIAGGLLLVVQTRGMVPADVRDGFRPYPIAYLAGAVLATPVLLWSGARRVRAWRELSRSRSSRLGLETEVSPGKGLTIGLLTIGLACLPALAALSGRIDPVTGFGLAGALAAGGVVGIVRHAMRGG